MRKLSRSASTAALVACLSIGASAVAMSIDHEDGEELLGGETTVFDFGRNAFSYPAANLSVDRQSAFFIGNSFFKKNWIEAPASTTGRDGLGPHFIARSCAGCHALDGRGQPPATKNHRSIEQPVGLLLRLSIPGDGGKEGAVPEPRYGGQLNNSAVAGVRPEGLVSIRYQELVGRFADGERFSLRKPTYRIVSPAYGNLHPQTLISPRVAPQVIGLGLLEAIPERAILALANKQQKDAKGVSGKPNRVWDVPTQTWVIGRFGWKANVGSVAHQTAGAFVGDMGITSPLFGAEDCTAHQEDCRARLAQEKSWAEGRKGSSTDIDARALAQTIFYTKTLGVPAQRDARDPIVVKGRRLFHDAGCASCHTPTHVTGDLPGFPELSKQTIRPYTDLLLHDMGDGLADGRADFDASGKEWRTPPLWGIGLIPVVNGHSTYLHDGRARNLMEAVLWHGGEAEAAKRLVLQMKKSERQALIKFLQSL